MELFNNFPLFPLNTVLFPGQLLPLRIFEPRYLEMIQESLSNNGQFGVVLIQKGEEVGGEAEPYMVGTIARIQQIDGQPDGQMNILCVGEQRFRILALGHERTFLTGDIESWPWVVPPSGVPAELLPALREELMNYLDELARLIGAEIKLETFPNDSYQLAILSAIILRIPNQEKQELLAIEELNGLIEACLRLLARENVAIRTTGSVPDPGFPLSGPVSPN